MGPLKITEIYMKIALKINFEITMSTRTICKATHYYSVSTSTAKLYTKINNTI